jgi:hypothetical protein
MGEKNIPPPLTGDQFGRLIGTTIPQLKKFWIHEILGSLCWPPICHAHLVWRGKCNRVRFFSTALLQECLDATGTPGTQGGLLIYTPTLGRAMCPPGIGQSAGTLICMHLLGRGWRQIGASTCAVVLFTAKVYWRPVPSFRHWLPTNLWCAMTQWRTTRAPCITMMQSAMWGKASS